MAPSFSVLPAAGMVLGAACAAFSAGRSFVGAPAAGARGNLRAVGSPGLQPEAGASTLASGSGALATLTVGSLLAAAASRGAVRRRAEAEAKPAKKAKKAKKAFEIEAIPRPEDLLESPKFPMMSGSAGGYMSKATRERHAITWTSKEAFVFELPTSGFAVMNKGENLCYFRKKEQCIALGKQLRKMKIDDYKVYRIKKDGTVIFMHPADGVFPEKVNKGRVQVNGRPFSIGQNAPQPMLKWTKYYQKTYEADALTTMFVKARQEAFGDVENLFAMPLSKVINEEGYSKEEMAEFYKKFQSSM